MILNKLFKLLKLILNPIKYIRKEINLGIDDFFTNSHNYESIEQNLTDNDIFIVGYPKSGNTWMQHIIASLVFQINPSTMPDKLVQDLVPDIYHIKYFKRYWYFAFFKSHELPKPEYKKVIYLVRDGRDAMISYYHYLNKVENKPTTLKQLIENEDIFPSKWHIHLQSWKENPYNSEIIFVKYEDLLANTLKELKRICDFLNIERKQEVLEMVATGCNFSNMKAKNEEFGWGHRIIKNNSFFRNGRRGDYLSEMPIELKEKFEKESIEMLKMYGYE